MKVARRSVRALVVAALAVVAVAGVGAWALLRSSGPSSSIGPEGVAIYHVPSLAANTTARGGRAIDGITCRSQSHEAIKYHVHVHVEIFVNGSMRRLPGGVGITAPRLAFHFKTGTFYDVGLYDCLYWLHTHVADGVIHVEAPMKRTFTLGQFFDVWGQPLGPNRVGPASGHVVVFENGRRYRGSPRSVPLLAQGEIQIDVGSPVVAYRPLTFKVTGGCGEGTSGCNGQFG